MVNLGGQGRGAGAKMEATQRILIVLHGAIGDVVRALPLLMRLREGYPRARITWAVEPIAAPLLEGHPALDERLVFERLRGLRAFIEFLGKIRALNPTLVLDLQRHLKSGVVSRVSGAPIRIGFHRSNAKEGNWLFNNRHLPPLDEFSSKLGQYLAFAELLELPAAPVRFGLTPSVAERQRVAALLGEVSRPVASMFVGSTWPSRMWFAEPSGTVVDGLYARGLQPVLLGGSADIDAAVAVERRATVPVINLAGRTSLRDLLGMFERSAVAIGPDSGPMHVAGAMGCPVVSLWGATSPARSAPYGSEKLVIQGDTPCAPCYQRRCPIGRLCMETVSAAAVLAKAEIALASRS
jgi:heptosyltransferase I